MSTQFRGAIRNVVPSFNLFGLALRKVPAAVWFLMNFSVFLAVSTLVAEGDASSFMGTSRAGGHSSSACWLPSHQGQGIIQLLNHSVWPCASGIEDIEVCV
jgi:hypothetical protein